VAARITRAEYEVAHASVARTLARLVKRGLLERHHRYGYCLTAVGVAYCGTNTPICALAA
jgi:Mn-dependent DtxR family transcriptional regulator